MKIKYRLPQGEATGRTDHKDGTNIADKLAIIAQKYAGFFTGVQYRFDQQSPYLISTTTNTLRGITLGKPWKEPTVISDTCDFCQHTTDERVIERVAGYQHQIDIEIIRGKNLYYLSWLQSNSEDIVEREWVKSIVEESGQIEVGKSNSALNRRKFIELHQDNPRETRSGADRPNGWERKALPLVDLPLRLKRKLCIEWNHVYRDFLRDNPDISYDFETREFFKEMPELDTLPCCGGMRMWNQYETITDIHKDGCKAADKITNDPIDNWMVQLGIQGGI